MEEGVAVYVQPIARARLGIIDASDVWRELAEGFPKGLPRGRERGLDDTTSWGRTYWGGALFCMMADVEIRKRTSNQKSFEDALRGIVAAGGNISVEWDFDRVLAAGDRAVGVPVLQELYARMGPQGHSIDLAALLRDLGVVLENGEVKLEDQAPLAAVRRSITRVEEPGSIAACPAPQPHILSRLVRR
jgi:predicted metalloprotease with PDZ domain